MLAEDAFARRRRPADLDRRAPGRRPSLLHAHSVGCSHDSYYRAAALGLRLLEAREARGRRFEEAAAATWRALGGELEDRDRLDLLLRDAAVSNPLAFSARGVFDLAWLTDDEPFGPSFPPASAGLAAAMLREAVSPLAATDTPATLDAAAAAWKLAPLAPEPPLADRLQRVGPATRVVVSGARTVAMLAAHANARGDLDLGEQVLLVTDYYERYVEGGRGPWGRRSTTTCGRGGRPGCGGEDDAPSTSAETS